MLSQILDFFALETLDTRLIPDATKKQRVVSRANPNSRWNTLEYRIYLVVFAICVPLMYKTAMDASNETNPNYPRFQHLLSDGWMFGRKVDDSDQQYRFFRANFTLLVALLTVLVVFRRGVFYITKIPRISLDLWMGIAFLFLVHGFNLARLAIHFAVMYAIGRFGPSYRVAVASLWVYGIGSLFFNERFASTPLGIPAIDSGFTGLVKRWDVSYNFSLLRMISFNVDYLEKKFSAPGTSIPLDTLDEDGKPITSINTGELNDRERLEAPLPLSDYNPYNYIAYLSYMPLFIAGPILTFNDYMYQSKYRPLASVRDWKRTAKYALRLGFCILVMEFLLHFMYVVAVSKTKAWEGDTPFQVSMLGMFNLNIIWLKLLIPWRFFRLWALLDGIDPPENMIRCMDNNYSALSFWRAWHRSFNRWVIRYVYAPLGGSGPAGVTGRVFNSLVVFSFVAVWHDIELKLLMWGWLVVLFLLPEICATIYFRKYADRPWYRHLCAAGGVVNIWMMMIANLFGFCLGADGMRQLLHEMFGTFAGMRFFICALAALFVGVQVMFELRELEKRKGIDVRC